MTPYELSDRLWSFAARIGKVLNDLSDARIGRHGLCRALGDRGRSRWRSGLRYPTGRSKTSTLRPFHTPIPPHPGPLPEERGKRRPSVSTCEGPGLREIFTSSASLPEPPENPASVDESQVLRIPEGRPLRPPLLGERAGVRGNLVAISSFTISRIRICFGIRISAFGFLSSSSRHNG
jgi:hypothetical protein